MTIALVLGMAQCKKEQEPNQDQPSAQGEKVTITLDVNGGKTGDGAKVDVNTVSGAVNPEQGDVIYVGSNGKYVGLLEYDGTRFVGDISNPAEGQKLYFYFLGNKDVGTLTEGSTQSCTVDISDQSGGLPVLSMAASEQNYTATVTNYTAHLLNKCALVEFKLTNATDADIADADVAVGGLLTQATVDFANHDITPMGTTGTTRLYKQPGDNASRWAILLPQDAVDAPTVTVSGESGTIGSIQAVHADAFIHGVSAISISFLYVDLGLPSGLLWAACNLGAAAPEDYGDYFAWGETEPKSFYDWKTYQYCISTNTILIKYCNNASYGINGFTDDLTTLLPEDDAATANWDNGWRMPTQYEWYELLVNTTNVWTTRNGVNGRLFTSKTNGNTLFLPAAGCRSGFSLSDAGSRGYYWSSSLRTDDPRYACFFDITSWDCYVFHYNNRYYGFSVRAVRSAQ